MDLKEYNIIKDKSTSCRHPWELARLIIIKTIIRKHVNLKKNTCVLDVGCGDIYISSELANDYPDVLFYAVDNAFTKEDISYYYSKFNKDNLYIYSSLDDVHLQKNESIFISIID